MRRTKEKKALLSIVGIGVALSAAFLGYLQYRWVDRASDAEEARLRRGLRVSTAQVLFSSSDEARVLLAFLYLTPKEYEERNWRRFAMSLRFWNDNTQFPGLLSSVYLIETNGKDSGQITRRFEPGPAEFAEGPVPQMLLRLSDLSPEQFQEQQRALFNHGIVLEFLAHPEVAPRDGDLEESIGRSGQIQLLMAIQLDLDVLHTQIIPHYMSQYLADYPYRIVRTDSAAATASANNPPDSAQPELSVPLWGIYFDRARVFGSRPRTKIPSSSSSTVLQGYLQRDPHVRFWLQDRKALEGNVSRSAGLEPQQEARAQLEVFYPGGPLGSLIATRRLLNLAVSIGILLLLIASMIMLLRLYRNTLHVRALEQDFVASMSHELRTPIAVLQATSENLKQGLITDPARISQYSNVMYKETRRLSRMVEGILLYSGIENRIAQTGQHVTINLADFIQDVVESLREPAFEARSSIIIRPIPKTLTLRTDPAAVRLILENLLMNAIRHGLAPDRSSQKPAQIRLSIVNPSANESLAIVVEDDGPGVPTRESRRIFEPFARGEASVQAQHPGSGLGLHLVRRITRLLGGAIRLESPCSGTDGQQRRGCRFVVELALGKERGNGSQDTDN